METSENPSEKTPNKGRKALKDSGVLKIQVVAGDVDNLKPEIKSLHDAGTSSIYLCTHSYPS